MPKQPVPKGQLPEDGVLPDGLDEEVRVLLVPREFWLVFWEARVYTADSRN